MKLSPRRKVVTYADVQSFAEFKLRELGLWAEGWRFGWSSSVRSVGWCDYKTRTIKISKNFFTVFKNREDVKDIVLHELAHAKAGYLAGHGPAWKNVCKELGANPERLVDVKLFDMDRLTARYKARCAVCGTVYVRNHKPKSGFTYHCGQGHELTPLKWHSYDVKNPKL